MRKETKKALDNITDTFTGADGGGKYAQFRGLIEGLDTQAKNGDHNAEAALRVLQQFSRLLNVAVKPIPEKKQKGGEST